MAAAGHTAELFRTDDELVASVVAFIREGLEAGVPGVVLATAEHRRLIREAVGADLLEADAEETLAAILDGSMPSPGAFHEVIGGLADRVDGPVRAYGELVSLLCERGKVAAAMALEELWNDLLVTRQVTLHCGYHLDVFDLDVQTGLLPHICRLHSHVDPASDARRFAKAVDRGLNSVLGTARARDVYYIVGRSQRQRTPAAQEALRFLSSTMPSQAAEVLAVARERYAA
jgi:hypothetical protein